MKLDVKTNELQNKVKYWVELSSGNDDIPQVKFTIFLNSIYIWHIINK